MSASTNLPATLPRNCTFDADDWLKLARHWYPVALSRDITSAPTAATLLDAPLVIYRAGGEVVVANDICPHRGVPLSMGRADGDGIACVYHGLRFGQSGRCAKIPAQPETAPIPAKLHLATYPAIEQYGLIWTCLLPDGKTSIPNMPHWNDAGFRQFVLPSFDIFAFAGRQIEGFLDLAHYGFVHSTTFGDPNNVIVEPYVPVPNDVGFEVEYYSTLGNFPEGLRHLEPPGHRWLRHFHVHLPFTGTINIHYPGVERLVIMNAASPVSARHTRLFSPITRNFDTDVSEQDVTDYNFRVFNEDKAIVEAQRPENLPLDLTLEAHIAADRSSIAYRRALREMGLSQFFTA